MTEDKNVLPKKKSMNKYVYYIILIVLVFVGATIYTVTREFVKRIPNALQEANEVQLQPIKLSEALEKAQKIANEKAPNSSLVLAADDEGDSFLYFTILGKQKIITENKGSLSKQWLFGYLKDKTKDYKQAVGGGYTIPKTDIFMVRVNSAEAVVHAEQAYSDVPLSTLADFSAGLSDQNLEEAIIKIQQVFAEDIKNYNYTESDFKGMDFLLLNKQYTVFLGKFVPEPVYTIKLRYEKDGVKRYFSADYMLNTKEINSKFIIPDDK